MHVYIVYEIGDDFSDMLSVNSTFDLAKAALHRYMNNHADFKKYVWDAENWSYRRDSWHSQFYIIKTEVDRP